MSEPQAEQREAGQTEEPSPISSPLNSADAPEAAPIGAMDDSPTIISRPPPRPARPEEAFGNSLCGRRLAHFELLEPIGVGGMAAVIRARDTQLDRLVALKILPPDMALDNDNVQRFNQEARAAAKLDHENIARVFFCGEDQGLHFIAFEFVEGENLRDILARRQRLPVDEAIHYVQQVASGLAHSAERGVVHRDIKPSNIIISANRRAKLVDMGLARSLERKDEQALTQSGVTLGSFDYISPEQALEPREADARSDIYSLGCTFYHMLTGRPPVPEGTAAKKLHHHQNVIPADPQELLPEIPDDVGAVVMRMIAKDPEDRFQRPEDLVQQLSEFAQKYQFSGVASDTVIVAGVRRPRRRKRRVLVTLAIVPVLVGLIAIHVAPWPGSISALSGTPRTNSSRSSDAALFSTGEVSERRESFKRSPDSERPGDTFGRSVGTVRELSDELSEFAKAEHPDVQLQLTQDLDLTRDLVAADGENVPGLIVQNKNGKLTIAAAETPGKKAAPGSREVPQLRTIRLTYDPNQPEGEEGFQFWTALTIKGGTVSLRNIRFEIDAREARHIVMSAVRLQEGGELSLENCEFVQVNPPETMSGQLSSITVESGTTAKIKNCYFGYRETAATYGKGQEALAVNMPADVQLENCAFAPHATICHLQAGRKDSRDSQKPALSMSKCSAFLVNGSVFQVDEGVACQLAATDSIFSKPSKSFFLTVPAVLIQQSGTSEGVDFEGVDNRYHNVGPFLLRSFGMGEPATVAATWEQFISQPGVKDPRSRVLGANPWADENPLRFFKTTPPQPQNAFLVDLRSPEMRQWDPKTNQLSKDHLIGVEYCSWGLTVEDRLPEIEQSKPNELASAREKIVDPNVLESGNGVYRSLNAAIADGPGDIIQIRHTGRLPIEPVLLDKPDQKLTIKPFGDNHPVLTLGQTSQADTAMFHLHSGKLRLEKLEFLLHPSSETFTAQAVVDMVADGQCTFSDCVATLEEVRPVRLALAILTDPSGVMRMADTSTSQQQTPQIHVERCFVRGEGDLVAVRASRPLLLDVKHSLVALGGSFLNVEGNPKEPQSAAFETVTLQHVTTYLTDHLVRLAATNARGLVPVQIWSEDCLFASAGDKPFMHLEGIDAGETPMNRLFSWEQGKHNAYSKSMPMLDPKPRMDDMPVPPYGQDKWKSFTGETDALFTSIRFTAPPADSSLASVSPGAFRLAAESELKTYGVAIDALPGARQEPVR
jgi:serine/threonine protein kinase